MNKCELLKKVLTMQMIHDLEYMNWAMMETLRIQPPASVTSTLILSQDAKVGDLNLKKGEEFMVNLTGLAHNGNEWPNPHKFIPERFDASSPHFLTSAGKKRNSSSYAVFAGGSRKCFGKTLAESTILVVSTYLSQHFNFEFVDKKFETEIPTASFGMSRTRPVKMIITKY